MEQIFEPNLTSQLLLKEAALALIQAPGRFLELGSGSGWITQKLIEMQSIQGHDAHLSDISLRAVEQSRRTLSGLVPAQNIRHGSGIDPWYGDTFHVIVNDIAAISEPIAASSTWYQGVQTNSGPSGLDHCIQLEPQIGTMLAPNGIYIVPLISLSDVDAHLQLLHMHFNSVKISQEKSWPLPKDLQQLFEEGAFSHLEDMFDLTRKYGTILAYTKIAVCCDPRG